MGVRYNLHNSCVQQSFNWFQSVAHWFKPVLKVLRVLNSAMDCEGQFVDAVEAQYDFAQDQRFIILILY